MKIKNLLLSIFLPVILFSCKNLNIDGISGSTLIWQSGSNNFYNQEASATLKGDNLITINGEVDEVAKIKLSKMPLRSVTVREARISGDHFKGEIIDSVGFKYSTPTKENPAQIAPNGAPSISKDGIDFYGTYRYDGYALCDILSEIKVNKESKEEFWPPVDLYIEVRNDRGDCTVFSWGELFYSADMYGIVIAKRVTRVMTGKTGELWSIPSQTQLVVSSDLFSERNIPNPTTITIKSLKGNYIVNRDSTLFLEHPKYFTIKDQSNQTLATISTFSDTIPTISYPAIYYGHGMGYKGEREFKGQMLRDYLTPFLSKYDSKILREGLVSISGIDGYRSSFSISEIINRNDQREVLLMDNYSIYAGCDAFADRSIKGLTEIRIIFPD